MALLLAKARSRWYVVQTITNALQTNTPDQAESLLQSLERRNQSGDISTLNGRSLKHVDKFTYIGSNVSSMENDINSRLAKAWTAIDRLLVI